jgi:arsenate reductase (thioredoxin)
MAEGWAKNYLGEEWEVKSAGLEAHGLNPNAVKAMKEVGIDISNQTSDVIKPKILNNAALVVTLWTRSRALLCNSFTCETSSLGL